MGSLSAPKYHVSFSVWRLHLGRKLQVRGAQGAHSQLFNGQLPLFSLGSTTTSTMFTSETIDALINNDGDPTFMFLQPLLPDTEPEVIAALFESSSESDSDDSVNSFVQKQTPTEVDVEGIVVAAEERIREEQCQKKPRKRRDYMPREYLGRKGKEESHWYRRYLSNDRRDEISNGESNRDATAAQRKLAGEFKTTFRVYFSVFLRLKDIVLEEAIHDPTKKDILGFSHDTELLLLGSLHFIGYDTTFQFIHSQTEIDPETHRKFHHRWTSGMAALKDQFIYLPRTESELRFVADQYDCYGFPGCIGSIDAVHIGWGKCPSSWLPLFKGKEKYPSVAFHVVVSAKRFVQMVSRLYCGTYTDSTSIRSVDDVLDLLPSGSNWLRDRDWYTTTVNGEQKRFSGCYFICDGGYLRWRNLIGPYEIPSNNRLKRFCGVL